MPTDVLPPAMGQSAAPMAAAPEFPPEDLAKWKARLAASESVITDLKEEWKKAIHAYMGKVLERRPKDHTVNVPLEFAYVELKKAQLAFQVPEVHLKPMLPGLEQAVPVFQAATNHELGPDAADAKTMVDETLFDTLTCSIGASKIGYTCVLRSRPVLQPPMDPQTGQPVPGAQPQPVVDPATGQPQQEQYCAHEEYFWDRFPVEDLLIPVDFEQSDFDRAAWLGMKFREDLTPATRKKWNLPDNFSGTASNPRETLSSDERPGRHTTTVQQIEGVEIWYQTAIFEPDSDALPGQYSKLVLIKGLDQPAEWTPSPYQQIGDDGKLHGMEGNPIHPLTLRFLSGSAYPVGDVAVARPLSEELSLGRSQMIQFRDRALPMRWLDRTSLDPETKAKLDKGEILANVTLDGNGNEKIGIVALPTFPRENFQFDEIARHDYEQTWAMGRNQLGVVEPEARTATEVQAAQGAADVRLDAERTRVLSWFTKGASKFASLLQQFKDDPGYAEIVGDDGVKQLQQWDRRHIQGKFAFRAKPDSALRIDADVERRQALALYNLLGKDPNVNRVELLNTVLQRHNIDPSKIVVPTPPQAPHPEPPKISLSFKGEDLGNPMVLAILQQVGIQLPTPQELAGMPSQPGQPGQPGAPGQPPPGAPTGPPGMAPHPGAVPPAEPLNKHALQASTGKVM